MGEHKLNNPHMKERMDVSGFFLNLREQRGLTQREFAKIIGCNPSYLAQLEGGYYKKLPMNFIKKIYNEVLIGEEKRELLEALYFELNHFLDDN